MSGALPSKLRSLRRQVGRSWLYVTIPAVSGLAPLLALPAVSHAAGTDGWGAVAVGQSTGLAAYSVVLLGWGLNGPQTVSRMDEQEARSALALSFITRLQAWTVLSVVIGPIAAIVSPHFPLVAGLTAAGTAATGLSCSWWFIGRGRPLAILLTETIVELAGVLIAAGLLLAKVTLLVYPLLGCLIPALLAALFGLWRAGALRVIWQVRQHHVAAAVRAQAAALLGVGVSGVFQALLVTFVAIASPAALPTYAACERMLRMGVGVIVAVPNAMQRWVGRSESEATRTRRVLTAIRYMALIGLAAGIFFALAAPSLADLLFDGKVHVPEVTAVLAGAAVALMATLMATGSVGLVAVREFRTITVAALAGALIGIPTMMLGAHYFGSKGAYGGELLAELAIITVHGLKLREHFAQAPPGAAI
jgi:O-antigen/teichoic acid export membrane protein